MIINTDRENDANAIDIINALLFSTGKAAGHSVTIIVLIAAVILPLLVNN